MKIINHLVKVKCFLVICFWVLFLCSVGLTFAAEQLNILAAKYWRLVCHDVNNIFLNFNVMSENVNLVGGDSLYFKLEEQFKT